MEKRSGEFFVTFETIKKVLIIFYLLLKVNIWSFEQITYMGESIGS